MNREKLFDNRRSKQTNDEWKKVLYELCNELSEFLKSKIKITDETIYEQDISQASYDIGIDIIVDINTSLKIQLGGMIMILVCYDEGVWVDGLFLMFIDNQRFYSKDGKKDVLHLQYTKEDGWKDPYWENDEYWEWEHYNDMSRWTT